MGEEQEGVKDVVKIRPGHRRNPAPLESRPDGEGGGAVDNEEKKE